MKSVSWKRRNVTYKVKPGISVLRRKMLHLEGLREVSNIPAESHGLQALCILISRTFKNRMFMPNF